MKTPLTTLALARVLAEELPPGVVNVVTGRGDTVGNLLACHPTADMVSLTGGLETGQLVMRAAADGLKRTHLSVGGRAAAVVFDDADLDAVVEGVRRGGFYNAGQDCTAACRVIAHADVYDRVVEALTAAASSLVMADPFHDETELGPVISIQHLDRIEGFIDRRPFSLAWLIGYFLPQPRLLSILSLLSLPSVGWDFQWPPHLPVAPLT